MNATTKALGYLVAGMLAACSTGPTPIKPSAPAATQATTPPAPAKTVTAPECSPGIWYCEDFQGDGLAAWQQLPTGGSATVGTADGTASLASESGNSFLKYEAGKSKGVVAVIDDAAFVKVSAKKTADYYVEARIKPISNQASND